MPLNCGQPCNGQAVQSSELADLAFIEGVDVASCWKWEAPAHLVCRVIAALTSGGAAVPGTTQLVGNDCKVYTVTGETPNAAIDTPSVNLTLTGAMNRTIQADVKISAVAGNQVVINPDGLFVGVALGSVCAIIATVPNAVAPAVLGTTRLIGKDCQAYVVDETPVLPVDTPSINLSATGLFGHTIQADLIIDPAANNLAVVNAGGLFVSETVFTPTTNPTILATPGGPFGHTPIYAVRISAAVGNSLIANADGLFVGPGAETPLTANDSTSINFTTSGVSNHTLTGVVILSPQPGNTITNPGDGIFAPTPPTACTQIAGFVLGAAGVPGVTQFVGGDCQLHVLPVNGGETPFTGSTGNGALTITPGGVSGHAPTFTVNVSTTFGNTAVVDLTGIFVPPTTPCSLGATIPASVGNPVSLVGLDISGCLVSRTLCNLFFGMPTTPPVIGNYQLIARQTGDGCPIAVPATFTVRDNFATVGSVSLGLVNPQGQLEIIGELNGGLGVTAVPSAPNGSVSVRVGVNPCNGWDTLLGTVVVGNIVNFVGIDDTGCLAQFAAPTGIVPTTACNIGALAATSQALPALATGLDATNCLVRLNPSPRAVLFGNDNGDGRFAEDPLHYYYDPTTNVLHIGTGLITPFTNGNSLVVGLNLSVQNSANSVIAGSGHALNGANQSGIFGQDHVMAAAAGSNLIGGSSQTIGAGANDNLITGTLNIVNAGSVSNVIGGANNVITGNQNIVSGEGNGVAGSVCSTLGTNLSILVDNGHARGELNNVTGEYGIADGNNLEARNRQFVIGQFNVPQGQVSQADGFDNAFIVGAGSSPIAQGDALNVRYDRCWQYFPQQAFGAQTGVGPQANDAAAIAALTTTVTDPAGLLGMHAMVVVAGLAHVFMFDGAAWVRAY